MEKGEEEEREGERKRELGEERKGRKGEGRIKKEEDEKRKKRGNEEEQDEEEVQHEIRLEREEDGR